MKAARLLWLLALMIAISSGLFALAQAQCSGFDHGGGKWCNVPVIVYDWGPGLDGTCGPLSECFKWRDAFRAAATEWNQTTFYTIDSFVLEEGATADEPEPGHILITMGSFDLGSELECDGGGVPASAWTVHCGNLFSGGGAKAITYVKPAAGPVGDLWSIESACIDINPNVHWGSGGYDRVSTARHELGHAFGLNHFYGGDCLMDSHRGCGEMDVVDATADDAIFCLYGNLFGTCESTYGFAWVRTGAAEGCTESLGCWEFVVGKCACDGGGCEPVAPVNKSRPASPTAQLSYEFAMSEDSGPYEAFAVVDPATLIDNRYHHAFMEMRTNVIFRLRVLDGPSVVGQSFAPYAVNIVPVGTVTAESHAPAALSVWARPTIFRGHVRIGYELKQDTEATVAIYAPTGRHVATLRHGWEGAGRHACLWEGRSDNGSTVSSGAYIVVLRTRDGNAVTKVLKLR